MIEWTQITKFSPATHIVMVIGGTLLVCSTAKKLEQKPESLKSLFLPFGTIFVFVLWLAQRRGFSFLTGLIAIAVYSIALIIMYLWPFDFGFEQYLTQRERISRDWATWAAICFCGLTMATISEYGFSELAFKAATFLIIPAYAGSIMRKEIDEEIHSAQLNEDKFRHKEERQEDGEVKYDANNDNEGN